VSAEPGAEPVGIFGGSGLYRLLDDVEELAVDTPYGPPSARIRLGEVEGRAVAFMPRHGDEPVSTEMAFDVFRRNLDRLRALLFRAVPTIGPQPDDACATALGNAIVHH
jgi:5'-methylthioadenosine phosphorylase